MSTPNSEYDTIFAAVEAACLMEGGDGYTAFQSPKWEAAANEFESWLKRTGNDLWKRTNHPSYVSFDYEMQTIYFSAEADDLTTFTFVDKYGFIP